MGDNPTYESIVDGIERFLRQHPDLAQECSDMMAEPGLRAPGRAAKKIADAMDAYNWITPGDASAHDFIHAAYAAVYHVCPFRVDE